MPRFDEPCLTRPAAEVCGERAIELPAQRPLPPLVEPDVLPLVTDPVADPLVTVDHPRIDVLACYHLAGWETAIADTWLRESALARLAAAVDTLPERWGICVFDAWRPLELQAELFAAAYVDPLLPPGFVSVPNPDPMAPPPHLTGGTVDVSLTVDGIPLGLGCGFDEFSRHAGTDALETHPGVERELRRLLYWTLHGAGFVVLECEWWHFEYGTPRWAAITGAEPLFGPIQP